MGQAAPGDRLAYYCHGLTFGGKDAPGGPFSPMPQAVPVILKAGYDRIDAKDARADDIVVWYEGTNVVHSAIIVAIAHRADGSPDPLQSKFLSKNGRMPLDLAITLKDLSDIYDTAYQLPILPKEIREGTSGVSVNC